MQKSQKLDFGISEALLMNQSPVIQEALQEILERRAALNALLSAVEPPLTAHQIEVVTVLFEKQLAREFDSLRRRLK